MTATYADQLDLLDAVADAHRSDADTVEAVILADARAHGGIVDAGRVRATIRRHHPEVRPQVVGATYSGLTRRGWLERVDARPSDDIRSRNRNKADAIYRLNPLAEFLP